MEDTLGRLVLRIRGLAGVVLAADSRLPVHLYTLAALAAVVPSRIRADSFVVPGVRDWRVAAAGPVDRWARLPIQRKLVEVEAQERESAMFGRSLRAAGRRALEPER
jgi:hypothetical protein